MMNPEGGGGLKILERPVKLSCIFFSFSCFNLPIFQKQFDVQDVTNF